MTEIRGSIWRPIAALTVLGAVCGLVALGIGHRTDSGRLALRDRVRGVRQV
ncbi:hypothetical protein [Rhodococcus sp. NPDC060176]|uniref:hypothetical protein n=1 Tax=Rhodococcus sp. NPDC060176 TaxID=3347062 RepID=UPI0036607AB4